MADRQDPGNSSLFIDCATEEIVGSGSQNVACNSEGEKVCPRFLFSILNRPAFAGCQAPRTSSWIQDGYRKEEIGEIGVFQK